MWSAILDGISRGPSLSEATLRLCREMERASYDIAPLLCVGRPAIRARIASYVSPSHLRSQVGDPEEHDDGAYVENGATTRRTAR